VSDPSHTTVAPLNTYTFLKSQILASEADDSALVYLLRMKNLFVAVIRHTGASASSVAAALLPAWAMPMAGSAGARQFGSGVGMSVKAG
jgi:hypothetical protein